MRRLLLLLTVLVLGACGGGDDGDDPAVDPTTTSSAAGPTGVVSVRHSSFAPNAVSVKVGEKVNWTFRDTFGHTATADDGSFDSGTKSNDATFEHTFTKAGTFAYKCRIHPSMTGTVTVS